MQIFRPTVAPKKSSYGRSEVEWLMSSIDRVSESHNPAANGSYACRSYLLQTNCLPPRRERRRRKIAGTYTRYNSVASVSFPLFLLWPIGAGCLRFYLTFSFNGSWSKKSFDTVCAHITTCMHNGMDRCKSPFNYEWIVQRQPNPTKGENQAEAREPCQDIHINLMSIVSHENSIQ